MQFPNERQLQALRERYPAGTHIRLNHMDDPYAPVPDGTIGEVQYVDDGGQYSHDLEERQNAFAD
ncbi:MAG TPA: DUF4314 domain-containing protein [Ruminococcus sp.]|nr:DUF4314 domain-containing protein [Ruminococcus sp.]